MPRREPIIPCALSPEMKSRIGRLFDLFLRERPQIDGVTVTEQEFWATIERLRGTRAATMTEKRSFVEAILIYLEELSLILKWRFVGQKERHDYEVVLPDGRLSVVETKGCLDGNNTNIYERPPQADEFLIWSLCQNAGSDPGHNAWSGIHTRLSAEVIHRQQRVDGVVIWDMLCGYARSCPKLIANPGRFTEVGGFKVPPPCIYLFPRTLPDPRNNPAPNLWKIEEVKLLQIMWNAFKGDSGDLVQVVIETRMNGATVQRRTRFARAGAEFVVSKWTDIKRARR